MYCIQRFDDINIIDRIYLRHHSGQKTVLIWQFIKVNLYYHYLDSRCMPWKFTYHIVIYFHNMRGIQNKLYMYILFRSSTTWETDQFVNFYIILGESQNNTNRLLHCMIKIMRWLTEKIISTKKYCIITYLDYFGGYEGH